MMRLEKRDCGIEFFVTFGMQGRQYFEFTIRGDRHAFACSYAVSRMLGDLIDMLYGLYNESHDECHAKHVRYLHQNGSPRERIVGLVGSTDWDNEGDTLSWTVTRMLDASDDQVDILIETDTDEGEKAYRYHVSYYDLCYAVAKAATSLLKRTGIVGYHFLAMRDHINMHRFLYVKYLALYREPIPFNAFLRADDDPCTMREKATSFTDEMDLLTFEM